MIELDYELDPHYSRELDAGDLSQATATDLEYRLFCSNVRFRVDGLSLDAGWGWIPIIGFAEQLFDAADAAARGVAMPDVEFTESQDRIRFRLMREGVLIEPTYSAARPVVAPRELREAAIAFLRRTLGDAATRAPSIVGSPAFRAVQRKIA